MSSDLADQVRILMDNKLMGSMRGQEWRKAVNSHGELQRANAGNTALTNWWYAIKVATRRKVERYGPHQQMWPSWTLNGGCGPKNEGAV